MPGSHKLTLNSSSTDDMTCPVCQARQIWSDECRRCKCDLSLLRAMCLDSQHARSDCLRQLRAGNHEVAILRARRYVRLSPCEDALRLLAVCSLLMSDWRCALSAIRLAARNDGADVGRRTKGM